MEIQVRINSEGALRNQRYAFTDRFTLVSELLQNARRAGATLIEVSHDEPSRTLRVRDNGRGLGDFQKLLTFHESGWDQDLQRQEQPFGVGFSKCLYASTRCIVTSGGLEADIDTAAALAHASVPVRPSAVGVHPGTIVELYGVDLEGLHRRIGPMCRGFPVPVEFNGRLIPRPDATDASNGDGFHDTPVGAVRLSGSVDGRCSVRTRVCLQGFCVNRRPSHLDEHDDSNVVHLDPARHLARLPDRDRLIDEDTQLKAVDEAVTHLWRRILLHRKGSLPAAEFVETFYGAMHMWKHLDLLDDVPVLPRVLCDTITYPVQEAFPSRDFMEPLASAPTREEVESGRLRLVSLDAPSDESMADWMLAWSLKMVVFDAHVLGPGHWVHAHVRELSARDVSVRAVGETLRTRLEGRWLWADVVLCERVRLEAGGETVELEEDGLAHEGTLFIPAGECSGCAVQQASDFVDSDGHWHEDDMEADTAMLAELIHRMRASDPVSTLRAMLERLNLERFPVMVGRTFRLSVGPSPEEHVLELLG